MGIVGIVGTIAVFPEKTDAFRCPRFLGGAHVFRAVKPLRQVVTPATVHRWPEITHAGPSARLPMESRPCFIVIAWQIVGGVNQPQPHHDSLLPMHAAVGPHLAEPSPG
jgi:hypothetical protein